MNTEAGALRRRIVRKCVCAHPHKCTPVYRGHEVMSDRPQSTARRARFLTAGRFQEDSP